MVIMSTGLEFVAGLFAIVGVADVAVRASRDVYSIPRSIFGAPKEIDRLCTIVKEVAVLAETARQLLNETSTRNQEDSAHETVDLFGAALKSLNRELRNLRVLGKKFRGVNKTWARVRYVLDERKTNKALEDLERSKNPLASALHTTNGYVSHYK